MSGTNQTPPPYPPTNLPMSINNGQINPAWARYFDNNNFLNNPLRNRQTITVAQAVNLDAQYVSLNDAAGALSYAITLAAPTIPGHVLIIEMTSHTATHSITMSLTNCTGGTASTTCTWNGTNQQLVLIACSAKWLIIKQNGVTLT